MTIYSTVLIYEKIDDKNVSFDSTGSPILESELLNLRDNGIMDKDQLCAEVTYLQTATGDCDYILLMRSDNVESLMQAINVIRKIPQVQNTDTHVGQEIKN